MPHESDQLTEFFERTAVQCRIARSALDDAKAAAEFAREAGIELPEDIASLLKTERQIEKTEGALRARGIEI